MGSEYRIFNDGLIVDPNNNTQQLISVNATGLIIHHLTPGTSVNGFPTSIRQQVQRLLTVALLGRVKAQLLFGLRIHYINPTSRFMILRQIVSSFKVILMPELRDHLNLYLTLLLVLGALVLMIRIAQV